MKVNIIIPKWRITGVASKILIITKVIAICMLIIVTNVVIVKDWDNEKTDHDENTENADAQNLRFRHSKKKVSDVFEIHAGEMGTYIFYDSMLLGIGTFI